MESVGAQLGTIPDLLAGAGSGPVRGHSVLLTFPGRFNIHRLTLLSLGRGTLDLFCALHVDLIEDKTENISFNAFFTFQTIISHRFQDWISLGTFAFDIDEASEKMRPSADVSGIVLSARRKFAG